MADALLRTGPGKIMKHRARRQQRKDGSVHLASDFLLFNFDSGSDRPKPVHLQAIKEIARFLNRTEKMAVAKHFRVHVSITVVGSADRTGFAVQNTWLAKDRAKAVAKKLKVEYPPLKGDLTCRRQGKFMACTILEKRAYDVQSFKADFSELKNSNLAPQVFSRRPNFTRKGGNERNRAVFLRVEIELIPFLSRAIDRLLKAAFSESQIHQIYSQLVPSMLSYGSTPFSPVFAPRDLREKISRNLRRSTVMRAYFYCQKSGGFLRDVTIDDIQKKYDEMVKRPRR